MSYKYKTALSAALLCFSMLGCDKGTSSDPTTDDQSEFNPPGQLQTVTGDGKIELRWIAGNGEKDFQGYHVFGAKLTVAEVKELATFPTGADISAGASIPRCKDNSALFEKFGFAATETECETSISKAKEKADSVASANKDLRGARFSALNLLADDDLNTNKSTKTPKTEEPITFNLKCEGEASTNVSRAASEGKSYGVQSCVVSKLSDGSALANGSTYTFFVVAVKGSSFNNISWVSNLAQDTPAKASTATLSLAAQKVAKITVDTTSFAATAASPVDCDAAMCALTTANNTSGTAIYVGRDTLATNPQRVNVSSTGDIKLQARGPQTYDPTKPDEVSVSIPGDQATTSYETAGTKFAVYGNQVFDIELTNGSATHYGKLVVSSLGYSATNDKTNTTASVTVTLIMQPKAGSVDYLR